MQGVTINQCNFNNEAVGVWLPGASAAALQHKQAFDLLPRTILPETFPDPMLTYRR